MNLTTGGSANRLIFLEMSQAVVMAITGPMFGRGFANVPPFL